MEFKFRFLIFLVVLLWFVGIFGELLPLVWEKTALLLPFLQLAYSHVCHQDPAKVIYIGKFHTFVCARCLGIYTGILMVTTYFLVKGKLKKRNGKILLFSFVPVILDVFLVKIGLYHYSKIVAFATGFILGSIGIYYFYETISTKIKGSKK